MHMPGSDLSPSRLLRASEVEIRAAAPAVRTGKRLGGYAAVFNSPTDIGGLFREQIAPSAFTKAIGRDDVRALVNHDANYVLGRTVSKTLTLSEDRKGLAFDVTPPDTTWAQDLMESIARGDISQCSFSFIARRERWDESGDAPLRTVLECELLDVSVVTYPAYADTSVALRCTPATLARVRARMACRQAAAERGIPL